MADSRVLTVRKSGKKKPVLTIVLVDGGDVWVADGKKKIYPLTHAFHTCGGKPDDPKFFEHLSLAGLIDTEVDFRGPARFLQPPISRKWGFYYTAAFEGLQRGKGNGDWEATDDGGGLLKKEKKRAARKNERAKVNKNKA